MGLAVCTVQLACQVLFVLLVEFGEGQGWVSAYPQYSPDGRHILFRSHLRGHPEDINLWSVSTESGKLTRVTCDGVYSWWRNYSWSPDSRMIVYVKHTFLDFSKQNGTLWIVDVNTGIEKQLTFNKN